MRQFSIHAPPAQGECRDRRGNRQLCPISQTLGQAAGHDQHAALELKLEKRAKLAEIVLEKRVKSRQTVLEKRAKSRQTVLEERKTAGKKQF